MKKKKKKDKNKNKSSGTAACPVGSPAELQAILTLEKAIKEQVKDLEKTLAASPQTRPTQGKGHLPFPAALGRHLLKRLLALEAAAGRLAERAEAQGDHKTGLKAIQVCTRLVNTTIRLVAKHPHLAEDWQPDMAETHPQSLAASPSATAEPETGLTSRQSLLPDLAPPLPLSSLAAVN